MPVTPTVYDDQDKLVLQWVGETSTGVKGDMSRWNQDVTIQATGTGTVTFQGSNDGTNFVALNADLVVPLAALSLAAGSNAIGKVFEKPIWIRPVVAGGTATVTLIARAEQ